MEANSYQLNYGKSFQVRESSQMSHNLSSGGALEAKLADIKTKKVTPVESKLKSSWLEMFEDD